MNKETKSPAEEGMDVVSPIVGCVVDVDDVIDLAKYVIEGVHPHDRIPDPDPQVVGE